MDFSIIFTELDLEITEIGLLPMYENSLIIFKSFFFVEICHQNRNNKAHMK